MNYAHMEFLSHEDIDRDVERIYRAYCDAMLLEYAANSETAAEYWQLVVRFRRENFGPLDRSEFVERARVKLDERTPPSVVDVVSPEKQRELWAEHGQKYVGRLEFLYWFDVRAEFWSTVDKRKLDDEVVVTPEQLKLLHAQVEAVQRRLREADAFDWHCRNRNDEILKTLSRPWPGATAASSRLSSE